MEYTRRVFAGLLTAGGTGYVWWARQAPVVPRPSRVRIAQFDNGGRTIGVVELDVIRKTKAEWMRQLPADSYSVTRLGDTEFAGTGRYDRFYENGIYRCMCCATALFSSQAKYASGTGWPSFTEPIAQENVVESASSYFGLRETEVKCARCEGHLGHVFDDGPPPGNMRYCINSVALRFVGNNLT